MASATWYESSLTIPAPRLAASTAAWAQFKDRVGVTPHDRAEVRAEAPLVRRADAVERHDPVATEVEMRRRDAMLRADSRGSPRARGGPRSA